MIKQAQKINGRIVVSAVPDANETAIAASIQNRAQRAADIAAAASVPALRVIVEQQQAEFDALLNLLKNKGII